MIIFTIFIIALILFKFYQPTDSEDGARNNIQFIILGLSIFLIEALRNHSVGNDTATYVAHFNDLLSKSWLETLVEYGTEPGFYILCKIIGLFTSNAQWMLAVCAFVFTLAICLFIRDNCDKPEIGVATLMAFQFLQFSMTGLRQTLALSIIILAFRFVRKRKLIPYLLACILAYLFHNSAILALPIYFLFSREEFDVSNDLDEFTEQEYRIETGNAKTIRVLFCVSLPIIYAFRAQIAEFIMTWFYSDYSLYSTETNAWTTFIVYMAIWLLYAVTNKKCDGFEKMLMIGIIIQLFVPMEPNIFRLAMYYQISGIVIIPRLVDCYTFNGSTTATYVGCITVLLTMYFGFTYYAAGVNPYIFFWQ